jgi:hypothetical protein
MDEIKRKVLDLIARDQVVPTDHFLDRVEKRRIGIDDALSVLKSGRQVPERAEFDSYGNTKHYFAGRSSRGQRLAIVVLIDEVSDELRIITAIEL